MLGLVGIVERRASERRPVELEAAISGAAVDRVVRVTVRDLSEKGAGLELLDDASLPRRFDLLVVDELRVYPVVLKWRRGNRVGVAFAGSPRKAMPAL